MNATERDPREITQEVLADASDPQDFEDDDRPVSRWFLIVPTVFMLAFIAWFIHLPPVKVIPATPIESLGLPELGNVQFEPGQPSLTADGQATLDRAAQFMHGNPNVRLRLEGYATSQSPQLTKQDHPDDPLTLARARYVETYLDAKGVERTRISGGHPLHPPTAQPGSVPKPKADSSAAELYVQ